MTTSTNLSDEGLRKMAMSLCPYKTGHPPHPTRPCGYCKKILSALKQVRRETAKPLVDIGNRGTIVLEEAIQCLKNLGIIRWRSGNDIIESIVERIGPNGEPLSADHSKSVTSALNVIESLILLKSELEQNLAKLSTMER